jgi:lysophospholipase L1-like esterase
MPAPAAPEARVVLVGDSTMAPRTGYGDALCGLFKWQVACLNLARGGRSTKSFRADGSWERVTALLATSQAAPTFVLVQLGHNDQPGKAERTTDLATEFPANLVRYIAEIRSFGAAPLLVTPLTRRQFRPDGTLANDLAPWAEAVRAVAKAERAPLIDLNAVSVAAVERLGPAQADALAQAQAPDPAFDRTHLGPKGAAFFARLVAKELARAAPEAAAHLVVGAVEPPGPILRPQMDAAKARAHSYSAVLGDWDPLAQPIDTARPPDYVVDAAGPYRTGAVRGEPRRRPHRGGRASRADPDPREPRYLRRNCHDPGRARAVHALFARTGRAGDTHSRDAHGGDGRKHARVGDRPDPQPRIPGEERDVRE